MSAWCVVAYRYTGGAEFYGPYELRGTAATDAAVVEASDDFEAAYVISMTPPSDLPKGV